MTSCDTSSAKISLVYKLVAAEFIFKVEESILILYVFFNLDVEVRVIQDFVKFKKIST